MNKFFISGICLVVICLLIWGGMYLNLTFKYKKIVSEISIQSPNLANINDGVYSGSFDALMVAADVNVTVKENRITDIVLVHHKHERGLAAEVITSRVIEKQSLNVDTISGATNSSKVILKAIENALESSLKK